MIQINKDNGRLSAWGIAANVVAIRWRKQPTNLPVFQHPLDLRGLQIYADFSDGTSEDITEFCSFTPSQGTPVYDEQYVNVTASYVEKSGKTITADTSLPVCYPAELRLVVNSDPLYENYLYTESPLFDPDTMPIKKGTFKPYCVWKRVDPRTEQEVIVRITPVPEENMYYTYNLDQEGSDVFRVYDFSLDHKVTWVISSVEKPLEDVTNWHNPYTPTIESFERPLVVSAQANIGVIALFTEAYIETVPIKLTYVDLPTTLEEGYGGVPIAHFTNKNIRFSWGDSDLVEPVEGLNDMWLYVGAGTSSGAGQTEATFGWHDDGQEDDFYALRRNPVYLHAPYIGDYYQGTHYIGKRNGDELEWTLIED